MKINRLFKNIAILIIVVIVFASCKGGNKSPFFYDFESDDDLNHFNWKCKTLFSIDDEHAIRNRHSLKIDFYPSPYPGITFEDFNQDWSEHKFLGFYIYNPEKKVINMALRIDDSHNPSYGERYNSPVQVKPGKNIYKIKLSSLITSGSKRKLNLRSIEKVIFFLVNPQKKETLYLDNVRIE